jgi:putative molybdopterin biosynthesis protein
VEIDLGLRWQINVNGEPIAIDELLFSLLQGVEAGGHLNFAAKSAGVSYRHAWGLVRTWEQRFAAPLLVSRRGRGAVLTEFALRLQQMRAETFARLESTLSKEALRASAGINAVIQDDRSRLRIASSHDERVLHLRELLETERRQVMIEIVGSESALRRYRRGDADIAGFHLPLGELGRTVAAKLIEFLDDKKDDVLLLEKRVLGLMSRHDKPCNELETLVSGTHRYLNRQAGSTTRLTFDALLGARGLRAEAIKGYADEEYTHTAVGALIVSGDADVAFGEKRAAQHFSLLFKPMVEERFYLVIGREFDSSVRQFVTEYCDQLHTGDVSLKPDEVAPTVAVMKRVHNAGFWKETVSLS